VQRARAEGYRSRAAYKLLEMDDKDHLIRAGDVVVDLGAAPGGWSQVAAKRMQGRGRIIAVDLLEMVPLHGVTFVQGDFCEQEVLDVLENLLGGEKAGLVLSDMSPNISGVCGLRPGPWLAPRRTGSGIRPQLAETRRRFSGQSFSGSGFYRFSAGNAQDFQCGVRTQAGRLA
jgi:hypothetical protein